MSDYQKIKVIPPPFKITLYYRKTDLSNNIHFYFYLFGKKFRETTHTSHLPAAEEYSIQKYLEIKRKGRDTKKVIKFEKVVDKFLEYKSTKVNDRKLGQKTFGEYTRQCKFLVEKFRGKDINSFSKKDFNDYKVWRQEYYTTHKNRRFQVYTRGDKKITGRKIDYIGEVIINRELGLLKSILLFCKDEMEIVIDKIPTFDKFDENKGRDILKDDEMDNLKTYWLHNNRYYWDIISFCASTGVRYPSEIDRCVWSDVDLGNNILVIRNRKGSGKRKSGAKDMSIPLVGESHNILTRLKSRPDISTGDNDFVFVNDSGNKIRNINRPFKKSLTKCNIINKHITMYSLRHYFATKMLLSGMPPLLLANILGHTSTAMIEKHYATILIQDAIESVRKTQDKQDILSNNKLKMAKDKKDEKIFMYSIDKKRLKDIVDTKHKKKLEKENEKERINKVYQSWFGEKEE